MVESEDLDGAKLRNAGTAIRYYDCNIIAQNVLRNSFKCPNGK
jgi:hypothetical protein